MTSPDREKALLATINLAAERAENARNELDRRKGPVEPGDIVTLENRSGRAREWLVLSRDRGNIVLVPADNLLCRAPGDVVVDSAATCAPLFLRRSGVIELPSNVLGTFKRSGHLEEPFLSRAGAQLQHRQSAEDSSHLEIDREDLERELEEDRAELLERIQRKSFSSRNRRLAVAAGVACIVIGAPVLIEYLRKPTTTFKGEPQVEARIRFEGAVVERGAHVPPSTDLALIVRISTPGYLSLWIRDPHGDVALGLSGEVAAGSVAPAVNRAGWTPIAPDARERSIRFQDGGPHRLLFLLSGEELDETSAQAAFDGVFRRSIVASDTFDLTVGADQEIEEKP